MSVKLQVSSRTLTWDYPQHSTGNFSDRAKGPSEFPWPLDARYIHWAHARHMHHQIGIISMSFPINIAINFALSFGAFAGMPRGLCKLDQ